MRHKYLQHEQQVHLLWQIQVEGGEEHYSAVGRQRGVEERQGRQVYRSLDQEDEQDV